MKKVLCLGVEPDRIILANPVKSPSHIHYARVNGVLKMTFDNEIELNKISQLYPDAHLLLRIRCDDPGAEYILGGKYGCDPVNEAYDLLKTAKQLHLNVIGISFHIGSNCANPMIYQEAIQHVRQVFLLLKRFPNTIGYQTNVSGVLWRKNYWL